MKKRKLLLVSLLCAVLACATSFETGAARVGQLAQQGQDDEVSIRLRSADGKMYDIAEMKGNVVLVSFGATWCLPCKEELAVLSQLQKEYQGKPVKFLWVNIEREDELSDKELQKYAKKQKLTFPVLRDTTKFTFAQFSTRVRIPLVVFFDKTGNLSLPTQFGMSTPEMYRTKVRERLDKLLAMQTPTNSKGAR